MKAVTIFEKGSKGRRGTRFPQVAGSVGIPEEFLRKDLKLPEVSEVDVVRHYTALSKKNYGVDNGFYPLGSCTMKYNPKVNEDVAKLQGFAGLHPYQPEESAQGALRLMYELERDLSEITGMHSFTLQPAAGAHGELTGIMLMKAFHERKGGERRKIVTPDSSHGTNPCSATMGAFEVVTVKSDKRGGTDLKALEEIMDDTVAGLMLTNPNTLGVFDENVLEINEIVHEAGALSYCDGANMNALLGIAKPGDMGFDIIQLNLHKTFSTPHGCGGPGSGPVGVSRELERFLPVPRVTKEKGGYRLDYNRQDSLGKVRSFYGNFGVMVKAYAYIRALGASGLKKVAENAVLNANYLMRKLQKNYDLPYDRVCMHEFVLSGERQVERNGVHTNDIAKRLLDYGLHAPTIYFPLIVKEAIMIEPTETESKETLDEFADAMAKIDRECEENPDLVKKAPHNLPVGRLDGVLAARHPDLKCDL
jgi:glycine dehydrogenase subunit 2